MKRKFLYSFVVLIALLFNLSLVSAATFNCTVQGYKLEYVTNGKLVGANKPDGTKWKHFLSSDFKPKTSAECPKDEDVKIEFPEAGKTLHIGNVSGYGSSANNSDISQDTNNQEEDSVTNDENITHNYIDTTEQNNYNPNGLVSCGGLIDNIPTMIPKVVSIVYTIIQIAVPIVLVVMGSLDLFKGITAQKEDEIKKGQQIFIKRLIAAAIVFFTFVIVKFVISLVADTSGNAILECAECFLENDCS